LQEGRDLSFSSNENFGTYSHLDVVRAGTSAVVEAVVGNRQILRSLGLEMVHHGKKDSALHPLRDYHLYFQIYRLPYQLLEKFQLGVSYHPDAGTDRNSLLCMTLENAISCETSVCQMALRAYDAENVAACIFHLEIYSLLLTLLGVMGDIA